MNLVLVGLLAGVVLTHPLEWPGKRLLTGSEWLATQNHLYGGYALYGGVAEVLGLLLSVLLGVWLLRSGDGRAWLCLTAAAAIAAMLAVFALEIQPINIAVATASGTHPPGDWRQLRDRWSLDQTVCFGLALVAFLALLIEATGRRSEG